MAPPNNERRFRSGNCPSRNPSAVIVLSSTPPLRKIHFRSRPKRGSVSDVVRFNGPVAGRFGCRAYLVKIQSHISRYLANAQSVTGVIPAARIAG